MSRPLSVARRSAARTRRSLVVVVTALAAMTASALAYADGIDVSHWQGSVSWSKVKGAGMQFAFVKATEGTYYTDPSLAANLAGAKSVGIYRGAYHFARPSTAAGSAAAQARYFVGKVGSFQRPGMLPPVLDLEATGGLGPAALRSWTATWLSTVEQLTGRAPIIYVSPSFWESNLGNSTAFHRYALWVAHYGVSAPRVPGGWPTWSFWQRTSTGRVAGIGGSVDINQFNGTSAQLAKFANTTGGDGTTVPAGPTVPTGAASTLSMATSAASVVTGQTSTFTGALKAATGGAPVAGRSVELWARAVGNPAWGKVAAMATRADGTYSFVPKVPRSGDYQVRWVGDGAWAAAVSPTVRVTATAAPTVMSLNSSATSVVTGQTSTFTGALKAATGGAPVAGRSVELWARAVGNPAWGKVAAMTTRADGTYSFVPKVPRSGDYQMRWAGDGAWATAVSPTVRVTATAAPTVMSLNSSATSVVTGQTATMTGALKAASGGAPVAGRSVELWARAVGNPAWGKVAAMTTRADGTYSFVPKVPRSGDYQMRWAGDGAWATAVSPTVRVTATTTPTQVRPAIDLKATATRLPKGSSLMLYGHLATAKGPLVGQRVTLYKRPVSGGAWVPVKWCDSVAPTGWFSMRFPPYRDRVYKAVTTGTAAYSSVTSNEVTVRVY